MEKQPEKPKLTVILDTPKHYSVSLNFKAKQIQFQHPWVSYKETGYGVLVCVACGRRPGKKLADEDRIEIKRQAERLMQEKPRSMPSDWKMDSELARQYFKWLPEDPVKSSPEYQEAQKFVREIPTVKQFDYVVEKTPETGNLNIKIPVRSVEVAETYLQGLIYQAMNWKDKYEKEVKLRKKAEAELAQNIIDSGNRYSEEKAITLQQAFDHWSKHQCKFGSDMPFSTQQAAEDCQRRVKTILESMGMESKVSSHTYITLTAAINETSIGIKDGEKQKRQKAIKRFFKTIGYTRQEGGLGIVGNCARTIKAISPKYGKAKPLSPKERLESSLPHYWKTFTATMAYAGLMPSEAFSLEWSNIDYDPKRKDDIGNLIELKTTDTKTQFKHDFRERAVPPFTALWKWLMEHKAKQPKGETYVFPKTDGVSWFDIVKGVASSSKGLTAYRAELTKAGLTIEQDPTRRLRHWFSTEIAKAGLGDNEHRISGHGKQMAEKHYIENKAVAKTMKMPKGE